MSNGQYKTLLRDQGFLSFLCTQFLGAFNDNILKQVIIFVALAMGAHSGRTGEQSALHITLVGAVFILPYVFFSGWAGWIADRYSKHKVLIAVKFCELGLMFFALFAFWQNNFWLMLATLFLMSTQSSFFSPSKYGILPEMLPERELSRANGLLAMSVILAINLGTLAGGLFYEKLPRDLNQPPQDLWLVALLCLLFALGGLLTSFGITRVEPSGAYKPLPLNPWRDVWVGIRRVSQNRMLSVTILGVCYFWFLGALFAFNLNLLGKETLGIDEFRISMMNVFLAVGVIIGSVSAGRLSGDKIELGLVPCGAVGLSLFLITIPFFTGNYWLFSLNLTALGFFAGMFLVPLEALLQQRPEKTEKGLVLATMVFLTNVAMLLSFAVLQVMHDVLRYNPVQILQIFGIVTLFGTVYAMTLLPAYFVRFTLYLFTHVAYRIRLEGSHKIPHKGPLLVVSNHVSYIDVPLIGSCFQEFVHFMADKALWNSKFLGWIFDMMGTIKTGYLKPREIIQALKDAREELRRGEIVCIFAEGSLTRHGNLLPFKRGYTKIVAGLDQEGVDVKILPIHLDRIWGSIFSFKNGKFFYKWPEKFPYPVTITIGDPLPADTSPQELRDKIQELGSTAFTHRRRRGDLLHYRFISHAKRNWRAPCMADSGGLQFSCGRALIAGHLLANWLRRKAPRQEFIGVILPASCGGALANLAVLLAGKVPVNLNFTSGVEAMNSAIGQCKIRTILTSKKFIGKIKLDESQGMVFLEDLLAGFNLRQKVAAALLLRLTPRFILRYLLNPERREIADLATVIFSSGSTGEPKGVMLSHQNILHNVDAVSQVFNITKKDCILGTLPLFHSFGCTGALWLPLLSGMRVIYHYNPLDAKVIGELAQTHRATALIATPTFLKNYIRKIDKEQLAALRLCIAGAEKLPEKVAREFEDKFGVPVMEGYGCTEMSPVVSLNIPDAGDDLTFQIGRKLGSVGHPLPGVSAKIVDPETREKLPIGREGLLLVKGPNRMLGYLGQPEKTAAVFDGDWYVTGDIARLDEDGFITITDRQSRFSKIGGEMVPHLKIEEALHAILGEGAAVVTAVPDEQKGEQLVVFFCNPEFTPEDLHRRLTASDLPNLWLPRKDRMLPIAEIPLLGSGKTDLKRAKQLALEKFSAK